MGHDWLRSASVSSGGIVRAGKRAAAWFLHLYCNTLFLGCKHSEQVRPLQRGLKFHRPGLADILDEAFHQPPANLRVRDLAPPEENNRLHLVAFLQKTDDVVLLKLVIVIVRRG